MTINQKTVIDLSDIAALEYLCPHCGGAFAVPIVKLDRVICDCPNCHETILGSAGARNQPSAATEVQHFTDQLRKLLSMRESSAIRLVISASDRASDAKA